MNSSRVTQGGFHSDDGAGTKFPQPVEVEVDCRVWDLDARPDLLAQAAKSWRDHGDTTSTAAQQIHTSCRQLLESDGLRGDAADQFNTYESELITKMDEYEGVAERVAEQLDDAAASVAEHQKTLDRMRDAILAKVPGHEMKPTSTPPDTSQPVGSTFHAGPGLAESVVPPPSRIVFAAGSYDDLRAIEDAKAEAEQVRAQVAEKNAECRRKLDEVTRDLNLMGRELAPHR